MLELLNLFNVSFDLNPHSEQIVRVENTVFNRPLEYGRLLDPCADCRPQLLKPEPTDQSQSLRLTLSLQHPKIDSRLDRHFQ